MKLKKFTTTTAALLGMAMVTHAQTRTPAQDAREDATDSATDSAVTPGTTDRTDQQQGRTPGTQTPGTQTGTAGQQGTDQEFKQMLEKWEDAKSENVSKDELPARATSALDRIAAGASIDNKLIRFTKGSDTVYCASISRDGQEDTKVFLGEDGTVEMTKQETSIDEIPANVRSTINQHTQNQSPEKVYRVMADSRTAYTVKVKDGDDKVKLITVSNTGEHIHSMSKNKADDKD